MERDGTSEEPRFDGFDATGLPCETGWMTPYPIDCDRFGAARTLRVEPNHHKPQRGCFGRQSGRFSGTGNRQTRAMQTRIRIARLRWPEAGYRARQHG